MLDVRIVLLPEVRADVTIQGSRPQDSELKVGKVLWIAGHSGSETADAILMV